MAESTENGVYLVIGATGSIGGATVKELQAKGFSVAAGVRDQERSQAVLGPYVPAYTVDATSWESLEELFNAVEENEGKLAGVALCVGSILLKPAHLTSEADFDATLDLNLRSAFGVVRSAAKRMMKTGGSIVLVSTAAARRGIPNHEAIAAAKAGVIGLVQSAAATYAGNGLRVNCVAPGLVHSNMSERIVNNKASLQASEAMHPLGRIGQPDEVARAIAWFLDPAQGWVTGQVLGVDGGLGSLVAKAR